MTTSLYPQIGLPETPVIDTLNSLTSLAQIPGGQISAALLGDSLTMRDNHSFSVSSAMWNGFRAVITTSANHNMRQGNKIRYVGTTGSASLVLEGLWTVESIISATSFSFVSTTLLGVGSSSTSDVVTDLDKPANNGYMTWLNQFSGQRFNVIFNGGKGGDTTAGMVTRMTTEILALPTLPQVLFIMGGVNDTSNSSTTAATISTNLLTICSMAIQAGIIPILMTTLPVGASLTNAATRQAVINQVNNNLRYAAGANNKIILIESAQAVMNPATGFLIAALVSSDGSNIHLNAPGNSCVGMAGALAFSKASSSALLTASALDNFNANASNQNIIDNAPWVATGGSVSTGCSGTAAQGFQVIRSAGTGTAVASVPARTVAEDGDAIGFNQKLSITSGGATDIFQIRLNQGTDANTHTRFVTGGVYEMRLSVRFANVQGSGFSYMDLNYAATFTDSVMGTSYTYLFTPMTATDLSSMDQTYPLGIRTTGDYAITMRSKPITIPTAVTGSNGVGIRAILVFGAALTAGNPPLDVYIGRVSLVRVA